MKKTDLYWLLAYPIYQIIGTLRHEASHVLAAWIEGAQITAFIFWPTVQENGLWWGYVNWEGQTDWLVMAAPYLVDLLTFSLFFSLCHRTVFPARWIWLNAVVLGVVSPLVNSFYNYWGREGGQNDVARLFRDLPGGVIHGYFVITGSLYIGGLLVLFWRSNQMRAYRRRGRLSFDLG